MGIFPNLGKLGDSMSINYYSTGSGSAIYLDSLQFALYWKGPLFRFPPAGEYFHGFLSLAPKRLKEQKSGEKSSKAA